MSASPPFSHNLAQLKKQAKDLLRELRVFTPAAIRRARKNYPRFERMSDEEICAASFTLQNAQHVVARECGYDSWEKLLSGLASKRFRRMEDLVDLDEDGVTVLLRECGHTDLVFSLQAASFQTREAILALFPEQIGLYFKRDIERLSLPPQVDAREIQRRVLEQMNRRVDVSDVPERLTNLQEDYQYRAMRDALQHKLTRTPSAQLPLADLADIFADMARIARREGVLGLRDLDSPSADDLFSIALHHIPGGTEPERIREILKEEQQQRPAEQQLYARKIIAGILAIQRGEDPEVIAQIVRKVAVYDHLD